MSTASYNCPCCGGPLEFGGSSGKLECAACGNAFEMEALEALHSSENGEQISFERPKEGFRAAEEGVQAYVCKNCGAELMTESTTTATECPYCSSPTILPDRLEGSVKPEKVIPFSVTQQQAREAFESYFKGKRLLPNVFLNSRNRIAEMRRLYVPYWLFDCYAHADMVYDAQKVHTEQKGEWEITRTRHYLVRRRGGMRFENIPVDGSVRLDDRITESLEPYDLSAAIPFQSAVLVGAMADHADVDCDSCERRAVERVEHSVDEVMRDTLKELLIVPITKAELYFSKAAIVMLVSISQCVFTYAGATLGGLWAKGFPDFTLEMLMDGFVLFMEGGLLTPMAMAPILLLAVLRSKDYLLPISATLLYLIPVVIAPSYAMEIHPLASALCIYAQSSSFAAEMVMTLTQGARIAANPLVCCLNTLLAMTRCD